MPKNTEIGLANYTFRPWRNGTKTSPGYWLNPIKWDRYSYISQKHWERFQADNGLSDDEMIEKHGFTKPQRPRALILTTDDIFDDEVHVKWRVDLFNLIKKTPNINWVLPTKRIGNVMRLVDESGEYLAKTRPFDAGGDLHDRAQGMFNAWANGTPPPNVWLGITISNQEEADRDIPKLLATPASKRFLNIEPLLGPIDLTTITTERFESGSNIRSALYDCDDDCADEVDYIDWVIVGIKCGARVLPMLTHCARKLRDQCIAANVPFLFKGIFFKGFSHKKMVRSLDGRVCDEVPK